MITFFRALNPLSKHSGINSLHSSMLSFSSRELRDALAHETIKFQWEKDLFWYETIDATYACLIGEHYENTVTHPKKSLFEKIISVVIKPQIIFVFIAEELYLSTKKQQGSKGVLDFLIFPLLSRKLISDARSEERKNTPIINALALAIAIPLEVLRHSLALALTLSLAPLVFFIHSMRSVFNSMSNEMNDDTDVNWFPLEI